MLILLVENVGVCSNLQSFIFSNKYLKYIQYTLKFQYSILMFLCLDI